MNWRKSLLEKTDAYCKATGRARSGVAALILNDPKFFDEVEEGRNPSIATIERVNKWFEENMPESA